MASQKKRPSKKWSSLQNYLTLVVIVFVIISFVYGSNYSAREQLRTGAQWNNMLQGTRLSGLLVKPTGWKGCQVATLQYSKRDIIESPNPFAIGCDFFHKEITPEEFVDRLHGSIVSPGRSVPNAYDFLDALEAVNPRCNWPSFVCLFFDMQWMLYMQMTAIVCVIMFAYSRSKRAIRV